MTSSSSPFAGQWGSATLLDPPRAAGRAGPGAQKPGEPRPAPRPAHARFIPREELGAFAAWKPGSFGEAAAAAAAPVPAPPPEPSAADWQARIAASHQSGYQEGYRDGLVALENFKQSFAAQATAQIGALVAAFDAQFAALEQQIARGVAETAVALARQVLRSEIAQRPEVVAAVAAEAVNAVLLSARHVSVRAHPHDAPLVEAGAGEVLMQRGARIVADAAMERGGVVVESDLGTIDARIEARWQQAAQALGTEVPWREESREGESE